MKKKLAELTFKMAGVECHVEPNILENKQVIIGFEHTSMMDTVLSLALFQKQGLRVHTLIKKELFRGPLKPILEGIGGIPVDRTSNRDIVSQMVQQFENNDEFTLVIAPEATRAKNGEPRKPIRTGFWHIAKAAKVPIVLMYINQKTHKGGIFGKIFPQELDQDLKLLQQLYKEHTGLDIHIPEVKSEQA